MEKNPHLTIILAFKFIDFNYNSFHISHKIQAFHELNSRVRFQITLRY